MGSFVILNAKLDMLGLDQSVGKIVRQDSEMMEPFVLNLHHMEEELAMLFGARENVIEITHKDVKCGEPCTTLDVDQDSAQLDAAYAHLYVNRDRLTSESHAQRNLMEEESESQ